MFKIGDKVVYITGKSMPKDSIHIVSDIYTQDCGCQAIAINGSRLVIIKNITRCNTCYKLVGVDFLQETAWDATSFRKLDDTFATETLERIAKLVEQEELVCL